MKALINATAGQAGNWNLLIGMFYTDLKNQHKVITELCSQWAAIKPFVSQAEARQFESNLEVMRSLAENTDGFLAKFETITPGFFEALPEMGGQLSKDEKRVCAMIRMGLRNKEIANLLHILPGSVKKSLYRIKHKLGLDKQTSLRKYIMNTP